MEEVLGVVAPVPKGEWNNATAYETLNIVRYNNSLYMAKQDVPANITPTVAANWTNYWMLLMSPLAATDMVDDVYPVGSIYLSVNNASPAVKYGGTWEQITDKFLLAASDVDEAEPDYSGGNTGGSKDAGLITHTHKSGNLLHITPAGTVTTGSVPYIRFDYYNLSTSSVGAVKFADDYSGFTDTAIVYGGDSTPAGNVADGTDKNMPPYLAVYIWKRIA